MHNRNRMKKHLTALFFVLSSSLLLVACNPYKAVLGLVGDVIELAENVVWFGIQVSEAVKQDTGIASIEVTHDGDLSVVRGRNAKGQVVLDSAMSITGDSRAPQCADAEARLNDAVIAFVHAADSTREALRLEMHLVAREVEACRAPAK